MTTPDAPSPVVADSSEVHDADVSALVLRCVGEIDSLNARELESAVARGWTRLVEGAATGVGRRRLLVLDLRDVSFFGASAVTALLVGLDGAPVGVALRLVVGDNRPVLIVVDALDLRSTFSVHHDPTDALLSTA